MKAFVLFCICFILLDLCTASRDSSSSCKQRLCSSWSSKCSASHFRCCPSHWSLSNTSLWNSRWTGCSFGWIWCKLLWILCGLCQRWMLSKCLWVTIQHDEFLTFFTMVEIKLCGMHWYSGAMDGSLWIYRWGLPREFSVKRLFEKLKISLSTITTAGFLLIETVLWRHSGCNLISNYWDIIHYHQSCIVGVAVSIMFYSEHDGVLQKLVAHRHHRFDEAR